MWLESTDSLGGRGELSWRLSLPPTLWATFTTALWVPCPETGLSTTRSLGVALAEEYSVSVFPFHTVLF